MTVDAHSMSTTSAMEPANPLLIGLPRALVALASRLPGRERQLRELHELCGDPSAHAPPLLFVNGMPGTGKSTVVRDYFRAMAGQLHAPTSATEDAAVDALPLPYAYVDCAHVQHAPRLLFESVLRQLRGVPLECAAWNADMSELARTSSRNLLPPKTTPPSLHVSGEMQLNDFVRLVRAVCDEEDVVVGLGDIGAGAGGTGSGKDHHSTWLLAAPEHTRYIVLDRAEVLRDMAPTLLPALARLGELTQRKVCVILVSHLVWEKFRMGTGVFEPVVVRFPEYSKRETLAILAQSMPPRDELLQSLGCGTADTTIDSTTYRQLYIKFADHLFESVHGAFHALAELRYVTDLLFPKFLAPVVNDGVAPTEVARLFSHIGPYLKGMLNKIYLRAVSSAEFEVGQSAIAIDQKTQRKRALDLPVYTKYLLIAAFLASYNAAKFDQRFFARFISDQGKRKKRGGARKAVADAARAASKSQLLLGPKAFGIDRMLAIFFNIIDEDVDSSVDIYLQISSLITTRLLLRSSTSLDKSLETGMKCKCNVSYEYVQEVARSLDFDLSRFLQDCL